MNFPAGYDRLVGTAFAPVEANKTNRRQFVKCAQHVLLGAAGEDCEFADGFWTALCDQTQEGAVLGRE